MLRTPGPVQGRSCETALSAWSLNARPHPKGAFEEESSERHIWARGSWMGDRCSPLVLGRVG